MSKKAILIPGAAGHIEAIIEQPKNYQKNELAIVCHPNPLQGGTMDNKVVTTLVKAFNNLGITTIRFNYRGVGNSEGTYGSIVGEAEDMNSVINWVKKWRPEVQFSFAGFSFGAYIAAYAATQEPAQNLVTIAPSVRRMPYALLDKVACPWLVVIGEEDEVVDPQEVYAWYEDLQANKQLVRFPDTGHFFHGKLVELRNIVEDTLKLTK